MIVRRRKKDKGISENGVRVIRLPAHLKKNVESSESSKRDVEVDYVKFLNEKDGDRYTYSIAGD
jgi:hypothetical protein